MKEPMDRGMADTSDILLYDNGPNERRQGTQEKCSLVVSPLAYGSQSLPARSKGGPKMQNSPFACMVHTQDPHP